MSHNNVDCFHKLSVAKINPKFCYIPEFPWKFIKIFLQSKICVFSKTQYQRNHQRNSNFSEFFWKVCLFSNIQAIYCALFLQTQRCKDLSKVLFAFFWIFLKISQKFSLTNSLCIFKNLFNFLFTFSRLPYLYYLSSLSWARNLVFLIESHILHKITTCLTFFFNQNKKKKTLAFLFQKERRSQIIFIYLPRLSIFHTPPDTLHLYL